MPTKEELTNENAELRAKIAELEEGVRVRDEDGEFAAPKEGGVYRYDGSGDLVKVSGGDAERNEVQRLKGKIADMGSLHGRIDNLPGVVG